MITETTSAGSGDDDVLYTSQRVDTHDEHHVHCTAGAVTVEASLDGDNWAQIGSSVSAGSIETFTGVYWRIRVKQDGADSSEAIVAHTTRT